MKKMFISLVLLSSCVLSNVEESSDKSKGNYEPSNSTSEFTSEQGSTFSPCANSEEIKEFEFEGKIYIIRVPILCQDNPIDLNEVELENNLNVPTNEIEYQNY